MKSVSFYTLGCKLNFSETSTLARQFEEKGYKKKKFEDGADIYLINTCSVTENADKKCKKVVNEVLKINPNAFIAIVGCYAQLKPEEISDIAGVDVVLGAKEKFMLHELIDDFSKRSDAKIFSGEISQADHFHAAFSSDDRTRTFLKVQDGCDYSCTFCTIPLARGSSRSDSIDEIIKRVQNTVDKNVKELVLTGVNTGDFGLRNGKREERFIDLIKALDNLNEIPRIRISSIEPNLLHDEIITFVSQSNHFVPHFHIPLQSGSDKILKRMKRRYLSNLYIDRVYKIKSLMPHCSIGVDVIVGFPGEKEEDFIATYQLLNELDITYLHVFPYSERENTPAKSMQEIVPWELRLERAKMLRNLSVKKKRYFYEQFVGRRAQVLFEQEVKDGKMHGFTENYIKVVTDYDPLLVNTIQEVELTGINAKGIMEINLDRVYETHPVAN